MALFDFRRRSLHAPSRPSQVILSEYVRSHERRRSPQRRRRLFLEQLERRALLAVVAWDGGAGTLNWGDANNWSTNTLPGATDDVTIDIAGTNLVTSSGNVSIKSLTSNETVSVVAGTFTLGGNSQGSGTLEVAGGTLTFNGANWTNTQTLSVTSGTLNLSNTFTAAGIGTMTRTGGTVNIAGRLINNGAILDLNAATGSWAVTSGSIFGGTVRTTGGAVLYTASGNALGLNGVTLDGSANGATHKALVLSSPLSVTGDLTLVGGTVIDLGDEAGTATGTIAFTGSGRVTGSGTIAVGANAFNVIGSAGAAATVTIDPGITISGSRVRLGQDGGGWTRSDTAFVNKGTINASVSGAVFNVDGVQLVNQGTVSVQANATVNVSSTTWTNTGTFSVVDGTLNLGGSFTTAGIGTLARTGGTVNLAGTLNNSGAILELNASTGSWALTSGVINGGTVRTTGGAVLYTASGGARTLNGVTLDGSANGATRKALALYIPLYVTGDLTLVGGTGIDLGDEAGTAAGTIAFTGSGRVTGSGTIAVGASAFNVIGSAAAAATVTIDPGITVSGSRVRLGQDGGGWTGTDTTFVNKGTINASVSGAVFNVDGVQLDNQGTVSVQAGATLNLNSSTTVNTGTVSATAGTLNLTSPTWTNNGVLMAMSGGTIVGGGTLSNLSANILTGGMWIAMGGGTLRLPTAITTNSASIVLDGGTSNFYVGSTGTTDALAGLVTNTAAGSFTITNGRSFTPPTNFTNSGNLTIGTGSLFGTPQRPASPAPSTNQLVSLWKGEGNANDSGSNNNNGTVSGTVTYSPGQSGQAFNFNGSSYVSVASPSRLDLSGSLTISTWVYLNTNNFNRGMVYKGTFNGSQGVYSLGFFTPNSNRLTFRLNGSTSEGNGQTTSNAALTPGSWYHVAAVYNKEAGTQKIYINGVEDISRPYSLAIGTVTSPLILGGYYNSSFLLNGKLDEVGIYSRALSPTEVRDIYQYDPGAPGTSLIQSGGTTTVNGTLLVPAGLSLTGGTLQGRGTVQGVVTNSGGTVAPGTSPGALIIQGDYTQTSGGVLNVEIGGTNATTPDFDRLIVTGTATLAGSINVTWINGFVPSLANSDSFQVLLYGSRVGGFTTFNMPDNGTVTLAPYYRSVALDLTAVPSGTSIFWINPVGGDWSDGNNWSTGVAPVGTDNAYISISGSALITHNTNTVDTVNRLTNYESLTISAGMLSVTTAGTIYGTLSLIGGTLNANGPITTAGGFVFTSGTLGGVGGIANSGSFSFGSGSSKTINTAISNTSTLVINGSDDITLGPAGSIVNQNGALIDWQSDASLTGSGTLLNLGTFRRSSSSGTMNAAIPFTNGNGGLVDAQSGTLDFTGGFTQLAGGTLYLHGGDVASPLALDIQGGLIKGTGTINATVTQTAGTFAPGNSPGIVTITGDWNLTGASVVGIEIQGTNATTPDFDQIVVTGTANLAGTLNITEIGGFTAAASQSFPLITFAARSGDFATYNGLLPSSGYWFSPSLTATALTLHTVLPTFVVSDTGDSGGGTLRQAILDANSHIGESQITFTVSGSGVRTIQPASSLPSITQSVLVDGWSQPGFAGLPLIELDGTAAGANVDGLTLAAGSAGGTVRGLTINRFSRHGLQLTGGGATVIGNFIGTDATGTIDRGNAVAGIYVTSTGNTIGGVTSAARNVVSGNDDYGIEISGAGATGNQVLGNYIGPDVSGLVALGNGGAFEGGVGLFSGATGNTIGGTGAGSANLISGHAWAGVEISAANANTVLGNWIGIDRTGTAPLANDTGVWIAGGAQNNVIGGPTAASRNIISGNWRGVSIEQSGTSGNRVQGNWLGLNPAGTSGFGTGVTNYAVGLLSGAQSNFIGTDSDGTNDAAEGNVIAGNEGGDGVVLIGVGTQFNRVAGNLIGIDAAGHSLPNRVGVSLSAGASGNVIGTDANGTADSLERNVISHHSQAGIETFSPVGLAGNTIAGNYIGTDPAGTAPAGNGYGISLGTPNNVIGGDNPAARNIIGGNAIGIYVGAGGEGTQIVNNFLGVDATQTIPLANTVGLQSAAGVSGTSEANIIAYNTTGYRGHDLGLSGIGDPDTSYFGNFDLAVDVGAAGTTLNDSPDTSDAEIGVPLVESAEIVGPNLVVAGYAPRAGAELVFFLTGATASGFGQGTQRLFSFVEGTVDDGDISTGSYGPNQGNLTVATGAISGAPRYRFAYPLSSLPGGVTVGGIVTGIAVDTPSQQVGEFSPLTLIADGSIPQGQIVVGSEPRIFLPASVPLADDGRLDLVSGYFVDTDSSSWAVAIDYGDGFLQSLPYQKIATGAGTTDEGYDPAVDQYGFALAHTYRVAGSYTLIVRVTDPDHNSAVRTVSIAVPNAAPEFDLSTMRPGAPVFEGEAAVISGSVADPNSGDTLTVEIDWADGSPRQSASVVNGRFTAQHVYLDEGNAGLAVGQYDVRLYVRDRLNVNDPVGLQNVTPQGRFTQQVQNRPPSNVALHPAATTWNEGDLVSLPLSFLDEGVFDSHTVTVNWGDGSNPTTLTVPANALPSPTRILSGLQIPQHVYTSVANANTSYTIQVSVIDNDQTAIPATAAMTILVRPRPLTLNVEATAAPEGSTSSYAVTIADPGYSGTHTLHIDWNHDGQFDQALFLGTATTASVSRLFRDNGVAGAPQTPTFRVERDSASGRFAALDVPTAVANEAPHLVPGSLTLTNALGAPLTGLLPEGTTVVLTGAYTDAGPDDTHTVSIDWGDGSVSPATVSAGARTFRATHTYVDNATALQVTVTDKDSATSPAAEGALAQSIQNVRPTIVGLFPTADSTDGSLKLRAELADPGIADTFTYRWTIRDAAGTVVESRTINSTASLSDTFALANVPASGYQLELSVCDDDDTTTTVTRAYLLVGTTGPDTLVVTDAMLQAAGVTTAILLGLAGDDILDASTLSAGYSALLDGGSGNDYLLGGAGNDVYRVGPGNDLANVAPPPPAAALVPNFGGDDKYLVTFSEQTIVDIEGANTLDFSLSPFGIRFDLSQVPTGSDLPANPQDVSDPRSGEPAGDHLLLAAGLFSNIVGSGQGDSLTGVSGATLAGGAGSDRYFLPTSGAQNLTIRDLGGVAGDQNTLAITAGTTATRLTYEGAGATTTLTNDGILDGGLFKQIGGRFELHNSGLLRVTGDGSGTDGGLVSFSSSSTGTIYQTIDIRTSGGAEVLFQNDGTLGTMSSLGPILTITGDGSGTDGGYISFDNTSTGTIYQAVDISTSGSTGVIFQNDGWLGTSTSTGPILTITGDGSGTDGGYISFDNTSTGTIYQAVDISTSGGTGVIFQNDGWLGTSTSTGPILTITGDGSGTDGGYISFDNTSTGTIYQAVDIGTSGGTSVIFQNSGTLGTSTPTTSTGPILTITGDGSGTDGGYISFSNTSTGTIYQAVDISTSEGGTILFQNSGTLGTSTPTTSTGPILTITGDGSGTDGGYISFSNTSTGTIYQAVDISTSEGGAILFQNSGTLGTSTPTTSTGPILTITGDGSGTDGGYISFDNTSTGTIYQAVDISTSGGGTILFQNSGTLGTSTPTTSTGPILTITGDGSGTDGGYISFSNTSTGTIYQAVDISTSGGGTILFQNSGTLGTSTPTTSTGPILTITGDGSGTDGGYISFSNTSTGTIYQAVDISTSGGGTILFQNSGTLGTSTPTTSTGPILTITGDGSGSDGGYISFSNTSTGTIYQAVDISTSGGTSVIFQNSGTLGTSTPTTSTGPILTITGDGSGTDGGYISFDNTSTGTIYQAVDISTSSGGTILFQNSGTLGTSTPTTSTGAILTITGDGDLRMTNEGTILGTTDIRGGEANDALYFGPRSVVGALTFRPGGGTNTLTNLGTASSILFDATGPSATVPASGGEATPSSYNLLVNRGPARLSGNDPPTITLRGGAGYNALNNFAAGTGFSLALHGQAAPDLLYNEAPGLPHIQFDTAGAPDRGIWSFPLGDVLNNLGDGVAAIDYTAPVNSSPDWLLNAGAHVGRITLLGGWGFNLLTNVGADSANVTLQGSAVPLGTDLPAVAVVGDAVPWYVQRLPAQGNLLFNRGERATHFELLGGHGVSSWQNSAAGVSHVLVTAGDAGLEFVNSANGMNLSGVTLTGGALSDYVRNDAAGLTNFQIALGDGDDLVDNRGADVSGGTVDLGAGNNKFLAYGLRTSQVTIVAEDGSDLLDLRGAGAGNLTFHAGAGDDAFWNNSAAASGLMFDAGPGHDFAVTAAERVASFTMFGGDGNNRLLNLGAAAGILQLMGGPNDDTLQNLAAHVDTLQLAGNDGNDRLVSLRAVVRQVLFDGGADFDDLDLVGGTVADVSFRAGPGNDAARIATTVTHSLELWGDAGNDAGELAGDLTAAELIADVQLGDDDDVVILSGALGSAFAPLSVTAGSGRDRFVVLPTLSGAVHLAGGVGDDAYYLSDAAATVVIDELAAGGTDSSRDVLDFSSFRQAALQLNLASTVTQLQGPLSLRLTDGLGIEDVVGTQGADQILGNARDNHLSGAAYFSTTPAATTATGTRTQWMYVDFVTYTDAGEHDYSAVERQAVLDQINTYFRGPGGLANALPWFDIRATDQLAQVPSAVVAAGEFITVQINRTPQSGQLGGESSEIDPGNRHLGGEARVQVNGLLGGEFNPPNISANFIELTAKIATHETGHLLGLWHVDAIGPIGFGGHLPLYPSLGSPQFSDAPGAFETVNHVLGSPASIGSDRFSDLGSLYFSEREALKLTLATVDPAATTVAEQALPSTMLTPQNITLVGLNVPNTLGEDAFRRVQRFRAAALQIDGAIDLAQGHSRSDFYRFYAQQGQIVTAEAFSTTLALDVTDPAAFRAATVNTTLILRDANGQLVAFNNDSFESTDARLADVVIPTDGWYTLEVGALDLSSLAPPLSPDQLDPFYLAAYQGDDTGTYRLLLNTFETANATDALNDLQGSGGQDVIDDRSQITNEPPTTINLSNYRVDENLPAGATIGLLTTSDPDLGDTFSYALVNGAGDSDNGRFAIVGNVVQTAATFDYETQSGYSIRVKSIDRGGLSVERTLTINVSDVNEFSVSVITDTDPAVNAVAENVGDGWDHGTGATIRIGGWPATPTARRTHDDHHYEV
ncbi:MAG: LamG-like jellyroll fold domain-containing protein [Pirellulales bacterium]